MWHRNTTSSSFVCIYYLVRFVFCSNSPMPSSYAGPLLFVSYGGTPVRPWWSSCWASGDGQNRDHQGLGQSPGHTVCGLQLLWWTWLQGQPQQKPYWPISHRWTFLCSLITLCVLLVCLLFVHSNTIPPPTPPIPPFVPLNVFTPIKLAVSPLTVPIKWYL